MSSETALARTRREQRARDWFKARWSKARSQRRSDGTETVVAVASSHPATQVSLAGKDASPDARAWRRRAFAYAIAVLAVGAFVALKFADPWLLDAWLKRHPFSCLLLGVTISAAYGGLGPGLLATALAGVSGVLLFVSPVGSFAMDDPIPFFVFMVDGCAISIGGGVIHRSRRRLQTTAQQLHRRNVELAELHRFRDEMSALIVHDLKSPLSAVLASLAFVAEDLPAGTTNAIRESVDDATESAKRLLRLLANLLDVSQLEADRLALRREPVDLRALLQTVSRARAQTARMRKIDLSVAVPVDLTPALDRDLIARVIENLLDNALRYTASSGRIELAAVHALQTVQIRVSNSGVAIPADARSRVFDKFGQSTPGVGRMNLGLGLYFCRLAVEAHSGRIWIEESPQWPTVFVIELPQVNPPS